MAGTDGYALRRWNCGGGRAARHCRSLDFSLEKFSAGQVVCGTGDGAPIARRWEKKPTRCDPKCGQRVGAEAALLEDDRLSTELEAGALETDRPSAVLETRASTAVDVFLELVSLNAVVELRGRVVLGFVPLGRRARAEHGVQRAEAVSDSFDNFVAAVDPCESHVTRADRVNVILHEQHSHNSQTLDSHSAQARSMHDVHFARCVQNSSNSLGDGVVRGRGVFVLGETKSLSTSTRTGVRRSAVYESAHAQQTPLKMHVVTWAGLLRNHSSDPGTCSSALKGKVWKT